MFLEIESFKKESIVNRLSRRRKFEGQVYLVGDVLGGLVCYDMINHLYDNGSKQETTSLQTAGNPVFSKRSSMDHPSISRSQSLRSERSQTSQASHSSTGSFEFGIDFAGLLLFNCPLAYMILQRKYSGKNVPPIHVPIFNLFYPIDQNAARLEPIFMQDECPNEPILLCRRDLCKKKYSQSFLLYSFFGHDSDFSLHQFFPSNIPIFSETTVQYKHSYKPEWVWFLGEHANGQTPEASDRQFAVVFHAKHGSKKVIIWLYGLESRSFQAGNEKQWKFSTRHHLCGKCSLSF